MVRALLALALVACGKHADDACRVLPPAQWPEMAHACKQCDFETILAWDRTPVAKVTAAMAACDGFCSGGAKDRFANTIEKTPWRYLAEFCKAPAETMRFQSASWFVLDHLARRSGLSGDIALPPLTITGAGPTLPTGTDLVPVPPGQATLSLIGDDVLVGKLPHATLDRDGIHLVADDPPYPGVASTAVDPRTPVAFVAPAGAPAGKLVDLVSRGAQGRLLESRGDLPGGWPDLGLSPVALACDSAIKLDVADTDTIGDVAKRLANVHGATACLTRRVSP